jgi:Flp pilus assembly protein TadD
MPQPKFCEACGALGAKLCCGRCHEAYYCNIVCQRKAWKKGHKSKCVPKTDKPPSAARAAPPPPAAALSTGVGGAEDEDCAICLEGLLLPLTMPCGHRFCRGCVRSMRQHGLGEAQVCPLCRGPMPDADRLNFEAARTLTQYDRWHKSSAPHKHQAAHVLDSTPRPQWAQELLNKAMSLSQEVLAIDPKHANAHGNLGYALGAVGDFDGAISEYRASIAADPQRASAHFNLGIHLSDKGGDMAGAEAAFRAAISLDPQSPQSAAAHNAIHGLLKERRDTAGAVAALHAAIAADPQYGTAHYHLGLILEACGDDAGAEAAYRAAVTVDPQPHPLARNNLATMLAQRGDMVGAEAEFRAAAGLRCAAACTNLARCLSMRGDVAGAAAANRTAAAILQEESPNPDGAEDAHRAAIAADPQYARAHYNMGCMARLLFGVIALLLVYYITAWVLGWVWYLLGWHTPAVAVPLVPEGLEGLEGLVGGLGEEAEAVDTAVEQSSGATAGGDPDDEFEF